MIMSEWIRQEAVLFTICFLTGAFLLAGYRLLLLLRERIRHRSWLVGAEDFLYWCGTSLVIFILFFRENEGALRGYAFAGLLAGAWLAQGILSFLRKIWRKLLKNLKKRGKID